MDAFIHSILGHHYEMGAGHSSAWGPGPYPGNRSSAQRGGSSPLDERPPEQRPTPPASRRAIRQLPTVVVTPEDLVDENNRECCICLDEHHLKDHVVRLPCAHIYHPRCITEWLLKHCTCPVCRYELPTDDPTYERSRLGRMKTRRPRFARYELDRMPISELRALASRLKLRYCEHIVEKPELVRTIVDSGKIDIIAAPKPLEYPSIGTLRGMGVGKLKRAMEDAGVFFDPIDVVEKEDMVQIFVKSGRVVFLEEEDDVTDEKVLEPDGKESISSSTLKGVCSEGDRGMNGKDSEFQSKGDAAESSPLDNDFDAERADASMEDLPEKTEHEGSTTQAQEGAGWTQAEQRAGGGTFAPVQSPFASRTVTELKALARQLGVDISDCIEKREMVDKLARRVAQGSSH